MDAETGAASAARPAFGTGEGMMDVAGVKIPPLMTHPTAAMAAATAIGFGIASQWAGVVAGMMQGVAASMEKAAVDTVEAPDEVEAEAPAAAGEASAAVNEAGGADTRTAVPPTVVAPKPEADVATAAMAETETAEPVAAAKPATEKKTKAVSGATAAKTKVKPAASALKATPEKTDKATEIDPKPLAGEGMGGKAALTAPARGKAKAAPALTAAPVDGSAVAVTGKGEAGAAKAAAVASGPIAAKVADKTADKAPAKPVRKAAGSKTVGTDDLKQIAGIGPRVEQELRARGITSVATIAGWSVDEATRIDAQLGLSGRVLRDDWIGKAKAIVAKA